MTGSLSDQLIHSYLDIDCPVCSYPVWLKYAEIIAKVPVLCPCCRTRIHFRDRDGDLQNLGRDLEQQIDDLLRGMFG